jgi:hypothetical protein
MLTVYSIPGRVNGGDGAVPKECQLKLSYQFCMKVHRMGNLKPSLSKDLFYAASQKNGISPPNPLAHPAIRQGINSLSNSESPLKED